MANLMVEKRKSEKRKSEGTEGPRVSVITPFLNGEAFLAEALESVIAQTYSNWELLLVNDGSDSEATTIAKSYAAQYPEQIRYLEHPGHVNRGISATRNLGIRHAQGELIAFLDADDVWLPSKLADQVALLDSHHEVGMVCGSAICWRSWLNGFDDILILESRHRSNTVLNPLDAALTLYPLGTDPSPVTSGVMVRADLLRRVGNFEEQFIGYNQLYEDQALFLKLYLSTPVYLCSSPSLKYRQHPASCVSTVKKAGKYHQARLYFLEWLEGYLALQGKVDSRVASSLRRAMRPYRNPRIHYFLSAPAKIRNRLKNTISRHMPWLVATYHHFLSPRDEIL